LRRQTRPSLPPRTPQTPPASVPADEEPVQDRGPIDPWERELLELLVQHPVGVVRAQTAIPPKELASAACRRVYQTCCRLLGAGIPPTFDRLMLEFDDLETKGFLVALDEQGRAKGTRVADPAALLEEVISGFHERQAQRHRPAENVALREGQLDETQQIDLLLKIVRQERARQGISEPTDG
jgi:hypothetical protein